MRSLVTAMTGWVNRPSRGILVDILLLAALAFPSLFPGLGISRFWDQDEGYYASVAHEMYQRGDWIVPTFNDKLFAHKPPMMYWCMIMGFHVLGVSELAARLPSALLGFGSVLFVYFLARRLFDRSTGLISGLVMSSCLMLTVVARSATADIHLTFFVLLSIYLWSRDAFARSDDLADGMKFSEIRWRTWIFVYAAMGFAVLCKGPIGVAFPITILATVHLGMTLASKGQLGIRYLDPFAMIQTLWGMRPITCLLVIALIAGPWFAAVQWRTEGAFLQEFLGVHHLQRFSQAMDNHRGPFYYYVIACLVGLYPWSAFAIPTMLRWFQGEQRRRALKPWLLVSSWIAVYLIVFSLASTKLPNYVVPAYPAFAMVIGAYMSTWSSQPSSSDRRWQYAGWALLALVGLIVSIAPWGLTWGEPGGALLAQFRLDPSMVPTVRWISLLGLPLLLGGCVGFALRHFDLNRYLAPCFSLMSGAMIVVFWQVLVPIADRHQTPQDIATSLAELSSVTGSMDRSVVPSIAVLEYFRPSMVYYTGRPIDFLSDSTSLIARLEQSPPSVIVLREESLGVLRERLGDSYKIVGVYPEFPRLGKVVVLEQAIRR